VTLDPVTVDDPTANPVTCLVVSLIPAESTTCTAEYVVTQADVDAGTIVNQATVFGTPPSGEPVTAVDAVTTPIAASPSITLDKASDTTSITSVGQVIPFTFEVANTGNVTLSAVSVDDPLVVPVVCTVNQLAPGQVTVCTGTYSATQADVDAGAFVNTAVATGTPPAGAPVTAADSVITPAPQGPAITIDKQPPTGVLAAGETISYTMIVVNNGNVTLTNVAVDDPTANPVTCLASTLVPGGSTACSADYTVTQADVDAGEIINTATVTGDAPGETVSADDTQITALVQTPLIDLVKDTTATLDSVGQVIPYTFEITNTGNVTLTNLNLSDPLIAALNCADVSLAPAASTLCTGVYETVQADIDRGFIVNILL